MSLNNPKNTDVKNALSLKIYEKKDKSKEVPFSFINYRIIQAKIGQFENQVPSASLRGREPSEYDSDSDAEILSKPECISQECTAYLVQVSKCLTNLMYFKEELDIEFTGEILKQLNNIFRDILALHSAYKLILEVMKKLQRRASGFYLYELILHEVIFHMWNMYKPFLNQYAVNAHWMGDLNREHKCVQEAYKRAKSKKSIADNISVDNCLYTVFNSLFSLELMLTRYRNCFSEKSAHYKKSDEAKNVITNLLSLINSNQNQSNFLLTNKQLNFLTRRTRASKVNSMFIYKGVAIKVARRDDKPLARQLVLFSDCLYITLLPSNIMGTSEVRQELSLESMTVTKVKEVELSDVNYSWGLRINAKEAVQDFFFDNEQSMNTWKEKLDLAIAEESSTESVNKRSSVMVKIYTDIISLGEEAPRWQKDSAAGYCNGLHCNQKFNTAFRRHHCRADGLLYCDSCSSYKINLQFERSAESRVCDLCYCILFKYINNPKKLSEAKDRLDKVMKKRTHIGKKVGKLLVQEYNNEKETFTSEVKYYCVLHNKDAILTLYEKQEDKFCYKGIILLGMTIKSMQEGSSYFRNMSSKDFMIEHNDRRELYHMKAASEEDCQNWILSLKQRICNSLRN